MFRRRKPLQSISQRAVVWAPHPDDETYAMGATIAALRERGTEVTVILLTDGEESCWSDWWIDTHGIDLNGDGVVDKWDFALARQNEFIEATRAIGVDDVICLGAARHSGNGGLFESFGEKDVREVMAHLSHQPMMMQAAHLTVATYDDADRLASDKSRHQDHMVLHKIVRELSAENNSPFYAFKVYEFELPVADRCGIQRIKIPRRHLVKKRAALDAYGLIGRKSTPDLWEAAYRDTFEYLGSAFGCPGDE